VVARAKTRGARRAARQAARSPLMAGLARAGLVARGVLYVIVGWIALEVAFGGSGRHAESSGALRLVAASAAGSVALWLLAIGFAGLALWRLSEVIWGAAGPGGRPAGTRLASLARTVIYGVLAFTILKYALGLGAPASSNTQSRDLTAAAVQAQPGQARGIDATLRAMALTPFGPWLLAAVAAGLVVFGSSSLCEARWRAV
jgi:Domain of Unknown Function (DUF1206)